MMESISVTCAEVQSSGGFELRVPADRFTLFSQSDCEPLWYSQFRLETVFRVRNETPVTPDVLNEVTPDLQLSDQWWWTSALLICIVLLVLICFLLRKRIFRCFQRDEPSISQREAPDSRDLEKLRSDDPQTPQESVQ
ncbi:hypothetical protein cypCar_00034308 [Cyprinus carpio]|nr:hypothetical protein cypCar_00034308 [Cyprinus carpio]